MTKTNRRGRPEGANRVMRTLLGALPALLIGAFPVDAQTSPGPPAPGVPVHLRVVPQEKTPEGRAIFMDRRECRPLTLTANPDASRIHIDMRFASAPVRSRLPGRNAGEDIGLALQAMAPSRCNTAVVHNPLTGRIFYATQTWRARNAVKDACSFIAGRPDLARQAAAPKPDGTRGGPDGR